MGNSEESRYSQEFVDGVIREVNEWKKNRNNNQRIVRIPTNNSNTVPANYSSKTSVQDAMIGNRRNVMPLNGNTMTSLRGNRPIREDEMPGLSSYAPVNPGIQRGASSGAPVNNNQRVAGQEVILDKASDEKQRTLQNKFNLYKSNNPANNLTQKKFTWVNPIGYGKEFLDGAGDLYRNYKDMRDANTIGADRYFHCKGHCEAAREGQGGRDASEFIGERREQFDEKVKGYPLWDCNADRAANNQGRNGNPNISCKQVCGSLRPKGLKKGY
jgi:hypothetical protein